MSTTLDHYVSRWSLRDVESLTQTYMASVYKARAPAGEAVLKLYTDPGREDAQGSVSALKAWDGEGAIRVFASDDNAVLLEYAGNVDLASKVTAESDDEATAIAAQLLRRLHHATPSTKPEYLTPLPIKYEPLAGPAFSNSHAIFAKAEPIARSLMSEQAAPRVLHGDFHHENILFSGTRGWLTIDPKGLWGDPVSDAAGTLLGPSESAEFVQSRERLQRRAAITAEILNVEIKRVLAYAYLDACLISEWADRVGFDRMGRHHLAMAELAWSCCSAC